MFLSGVYASGYSEYFSNYDQLPNLCNTVSQFSPVFGAVLLNGDVPTNVIELVEYACANVDDLNESFVQGTENMIFKVKKICH